MFNFPSNDLFTADTFQPSPNNSLMLLFNTKLLNCLN